MKTLILHETWIGTQFPCALEYGDNTGLIDNEERQLDDMGFSTSIKGG
jgi:hypothetical protein